MGATGRLERPVEFLPPEHRLDPLWAAAALAEAGADALHLTAARSSAEPVRKLLDRLQSIPIPLTVNAEPEGLDELDALLAAGATRVAIGDAALRDPDLIRAVATRFGSAAVAVSVRARLEADYGRVVCGADRRPTEWDAVDWARVIAAQGAGEVILECGGSADEPFALELLEAVSGAVAIPVVAAGETREAEDIFDALMIGGAEGVIVEASVLKGRSAVGAIKRYLAEHGLRVRQG